MSDQPEEKVKPKGFLNKLTAFWNNLNNSIKALSGVLAAILIILTQFDKITDKLFPKVSEETLNNIVVLDTLTTNEREVIFNECAKFELQCLDEILIACEKMRINTDAQNEAIDWISKMNNQLGNDKVFDACVIRANNFMDVEMNAISDVEDVFNGIGFYIELFIRLESGHTDDVKLMFDKIRNKIDDQTIMNSFDKEILYDQLP